MKLHSKLGKILSFTYLGIFTLFAGIGWYAVEYGGSEPFILFPLFAITLPWTALIMPITDSLGYDGFYSVLFLGALANTAIIYGVGSFIGKLFSKKGSSPTASNTLSPHS